MSQLSRGKQVMKEAYQHFWRSRNHRNPLLLESYCRVCYKFIGAGQSESNLNLVEHAHRIVCKLAAEADDERRTGTDA